ncbi:hypothetical protein BSKO_04745 [Bryopsis sp. KO-2023]|nr:hypothetical protein BSKO_04745 [Bryopsis sp. KO-2023]
MSDLGGIWVEGLQKVPVIDLSLDDETVGKLFYDACSTTGAFYITNHGLSESFVDGYLSMVKKMYDLPLKEKMKLHSNEKNRGYVPMGKEILSKDQHAKADTKEGFLLTREIPASSDEAKLPLHGQNQWFDEAILPGFRKATENFQAAMTALATRLLGYLEISLGLPKDFFVKFFDRPMDFLKLLKYHPVVSDPKNGIFAAGPHRDYGVATIIATDEVPGLQVEIEGVWNDVPPISGAFMIVTGDLLERWTNGKFKSVLHRVINTEGKERYSVGFFYEPTFDTLVEVIPSCCNGQPPKHPPITSGQHTLQKMTSHVHAGYGNSSA